MRVEIKKRMSRSMKNKKNPTLPIELIREILLRSPVSSVLRFKCVCKSWLSLISDPQFGISHYDLNASPSYRLLLKSNDFYAQSVDVESPFIQQSSVSWYWNNLRAVNLLLPPPSPPLSRPPRCPDFYLVYQHDESRNQPQIWGSCNGFILLCYPKGFGLNHWDLILWNPSIGVHKRLPNFECCYSTDYILYGFGYDPSTDDYLITLISFKFGIHIFSFKTYSWNRIDINVPYSDPGVDFRGGSFVSGALHWLICPDGIIPMIIAFDIIQKSLSEISLLDLFSMGNYIDRLGVMGGCLSLCRLVQGCTMGEMWVMKEYKVESSWTRTFVFPAYKFSPICITRDGGILGSNSGRLEKRNDIGERLECLTYGEGNELYFCANIQYSMYKESLLLLPTVIRKATEDDQGETSEDDQGQTSEDDQGETSEDDQH